MDHAVLQGWRATLIPLLAVPLSLIGAFILFPAFGFSINTLSLFGLVLAIGLVVDDAIGRPSVTLAIRLHRKLKRENPTAKPAQIWARVYPKVIPNYAGLNKEARWMEQLAFG